MCQRLVKYLKIALSLVRNFEDLVVKHILRIENEEVNELAQLVLGYEINDSKFDKLI